MQKEIYLTIEGEPGREVQVWYRGDQGSDLPDPSPVVFTGRLGSNGRITVRVPRANLCIGFPEKNGCDPHDFRKETGDSVTVSLKTEQTGGAVSKSDWQSDGAVDGEDKIKESADHDLEAQQEVFAALGETFDKADDAGTFGASARPWRVARSLLTLREQVNLLAPGRSKASDGTIGDDRHCSGNPRASDHCAWITDGPNGVVSAMDITHDPAHGCNAERIAEAIRGARDGRIKYIIWNRRICNSSPIDGHAAWAWRPYNGRNGHTQHIHISVKSDRAHYDSTAPWEI